MNTVINAQNWTVTQILARVFDAQETQDKLRIIVDPELLGKVRALTSEARENAIKQGGSWIFVEFVKAESKAPAQTVKLPNVPGVDQAQIKAMQACGQIMAETLAELVGVSVQDLQTKMAAALAKGLTVSEAKERLVKSVLKQVCLSTFPAGPEGELAWKYAVVVQLLTEMSAAAGAAISDKGIDQYLHLGYRQAPHMPKFVMEGLDGYLAIELNEYDSVMGDE